MTNTEKWHFRTSVDDKFYFHLANTFCTWHCRNYMLWKIIVDNVERWKNVRRPGIEPGSQEWESCMIPLHQRRVNLNCRYYIFKGIDVHIVFRAYWSRFRNSILFDTSKMYNDDLFVNCPFIVIENKRHLCVKRKTPQKRNFVQKYGKYAPSESRTHDPWFTRPVL